jgi:hypothetical protein
MGSIDDVLTGSGPGDTGLTQGPSPQPAPLESGVVFGYDVADYTHLGAALGSEYDEQHASITVREVSGVRASTGKAVGEAIEKTLPFLYGAVFSAGAQATISDVVYVTDKFMITSAVEPRSSRSTMVMSFNQPTVYTAGMRAYIFRYSGHVLINKRDGDGRNDFYTLYRKYMRASAGLVGTDRRSFPWLVELTFRDMLRRGYVLDASIGINALEPTKGDISFTLFIVDEQFL